MKILVVGTGFIGHSLAKALQHDHDVHVVNRSEIPEYRTELLPNVTILPSTLAEHFTTTTEYNTVIYTASTPNAVNVKMDLLNTSDGIIKGPVNCIQNINTKHFIYLSSSMVYGNFHVIPTEIQPLEPIEPYGMMKAASEDLVKFYCNERQIKYTIIRPSAVYGPNDKIERVISLFIDAAMNDNELIVKGSATLDFTYINDLVDGITKCITNNNALNETFNITMGEAVPILAAAAIVCDVLQKGKIISKEHDQLYPKRGALNINKARVLLDYNPSTTIVKGIKKYILKWREQ